MPFGDGRSTADVAHYQQDEPDAEQFLTMAKLMGVALAVMVAVFSEHQDHKRRHTHECPRNGGKLTWMTHVPSWLDGRGGGVGREVSSIPVPRRTAAAPHRGEFVTEVVPAAAPQGEGGTEVAPASHEETYPPQDLLTPCHYTERAIGAASFKLLRCPDCGMERIDRKVHYSSGYSPHLTCGCRAKREETHILVHATTSHSGVKRHVEHCAHCKSRQEWTSIIPQVVERLETTSSGGGGGFGGGHSSGGSSGGASWLLSNGQASEADAPVAPSEKAEVALLKMKAKAAALLGWDPTTKCPPERVEEGAQGGR